MLEHVKISQKEIEKQELLRIIEVKEKNIN